MTSDSSGRGWLSGGGALRALLPQSPMTMTVPTSWALASLSPPTFTSQESELYSTEGGEEAQRG